MLVLQLVTQVCVVAACAAVFLFLGVQQLRAEAEASALNIARSVAAAPDVRELVAEYSADPGTPDADALRDGPLQSYAAGVTRRTDVLFVVITDDQGIRLAHPDPDRLGEVVSTSFDDALAGREVVTWETGTLGESARAKVPVYGPDGGRPVGEVSVGFERASVFRDLPSLLTGVAAAVLMALAATSAEWALFPLSYGWAAIGNEAAYADQFGGVSRPPYTAWIGYDLFAVAISSALAQGLRVMANANPRGFGGG